MNCFNEGLVQSLHCMGMAWKDVPLDWEIRETNIARPH